MFLLRKDSFRGVFSICFCLSNVLDEDDAGSGSDESAVDRLPFRVHMLRDTKSMPGLESRYDT